jgi:hypothetical protein
MASIIELEKTISGLNDKDNELVNRFFLINTTVGKLKLPEEMKPWAEKSFGSIAGVESQSIIKVLNRLTFESALFNELRAKRPIEAKADEDAIKAINESVGDPFCKPLTGTPEDSFGRVKGKYCISASNVAKYDGLHGLIIFKSHNPLEFSEKELQDDFSTALKWFDKAYDSNNNAVYPFMLWNCLWRSGASIIHGHFQLVLGEGSHYAEAEQYNKVRQEYAQKFGSDYFLDLYRAHELLGLGFEKKKIRVYASITPRKDKEITIVSEKLDKNFVSAIYKVANCLVKELGVNSFNMGIILPPLAKAAKKANKANAANSLTSLADWKGFPFIARIVNRGALNAKTSDIGGMEMYARGNVIETDPYKVFEKVKSVF